jgi:hypothetical protein
VQRGKQSKGGAGRREKGRERTAIEDVVDEEKVEAEEEYDGLTPNFPLKYPA